MSLNPTIQTVVQFPEQTAVPKEQSENALFDILQENVKDNDTYCQELINKILKLPYAKLPDFFSHHCDFATNPIKWLNKFEKLISENEEIFVSTTKRGRMIKCYTIIESKRKELEILRNRHTKIKPPMQYINADSAVLTDLPALAQPPNSFIFSRVRSNSGAVFTCSAVGPPTLPAKNPCCPLILKCRTSPIVPTYFISPFCLAIF